MNDGGFKTEGHRETQRTNFQAAIEASNSLLHFAGFPPTA